jgi:hypothetical protein
VGSPRRDAERGAEDRARAGAVAPRADIGVSVSDHRVQLLELDDHLVPRHGWQPGVDGADRAVELRWRHVVKEIRVVRGHCLTQERQILSPATHIGGVERRRSLCSQGAGDQNTRCCTKNCYE